MIRKPHPSSVLKTLSDEDQAALFEFMSDSKKTLADGVAWLFSNNGVRTSDSSLSEWRQWYKMKTDIEAWNADSEALKEMLSTETEIDQNLIPKIAEAVFISRAAKTGDAKMFATVASIIQRHKELESNQQSHADKMQLEDKKLARKDRALTQAEKKIAQQERKLLILEAKERDATAVLSATDMSEEEKVNKMRTIFGR
jgi:hypothetical protein